MIALASLIQANQAATNQAASGTAAQQSNLGYLPYPLVPRSVDWDKAPKTALNPNENLETTAIQVPEKEAIVGEKMLPGHECVEDEDCVHGASCMPQFSWSGTYEKRCVCRPPFLHVGETCIPPPM